MNKAKAFSIDKKNAALENGELTEIPALITDVYYSHEGKYFQLQVFFNKNIVFHRSTNRYVAVSYTHLDVYKRRDPPECFSPDLYDGIAAILPENHLHHCEYNRRQPGCVPEQDHGAFLLGYSVQYRYHDCSCSWSIHSDPACHQNSYRLQNAACFHSPGRTVVQRITPADLLL